MRLNYLTMKMEEEEDKEIMDLFRKAERDAERMDKLREGCPYLEPIASIPVSYPKCNHPESKTRACRDLEDCPKAGGADGN